MQCINYLLFDAAWKLDTGKPGSDLAGDAAASFASASMLFKDSDPAYAAELLTHAKQLFEFADTHRGLYSTSIPNAGDFYK